MVPSLAVWYPALVKLRSLVPENLHVRISDLVFLRSRGTKLRFLAEFGGAKPPILEEGRCHIADLRGSCPRKMDTGSSGGRAVVVVSLSTAPDESSRSSRGTAPGSSALWIRSMWCSGWSTCSTRPAGRRGAAAKAEGSRLGLPSAPPLPQSRRRRPQPDLRKCQRVTTPLAKSHPGLRCCM